MFEVRQTLVRGMGAKATIEYKDPEPEKSQINKSSINAVSRPAHPGGRFNVMVHKLKYRD